MHAVRRDLLLAGGAATILVSTLFIEERLQALIIAIATFLVAPVVWWIRNRPYVRVEHFPLPEAAIAGFVGFAVAFFVVAAVGAAMTVLGAAVVLLGVALLERVRLRGAAVPTEGETRGRVAFEGTVHAVGDPPHVPGTDHEVAVWVARYGRKRWTSTPRFEVRSDTRRVLVEPGSSRLRGSPRVRTGSRGEGAIRALGLEVPDPPSYADPVRVWSFRDGDDVYVVGRVALEDDPAAPTLRDPARISVFTEQTLIGRGRLADVRRAADVRALLWSAIAIGAIGLMAAGLGRVG